MSSITDEQIEARRENSRRLAREWKMFIKVSCEKAHFTTVANAVSVASLQLHKNLPKEDFERDEFLLEIDQILHELRIVGEWFWRNQ